MPFRLRQFAAEGVGNLSLLRGSAMLGLMRMETLIFTSIKRDAPLFSYDCIHAIGNATLLAEWYDTFVSMPDGTAAAALEAPLAKLASLPTYGLGLHWYNSLKLPASCARRGCLHPLRQVLRLTPAFFLF